MKLFQLKIESKVKIIMNKLILNLAPILLIAILAGCGEGDPIPVPVGTKLPGGFVVIDSRMFKSLETCIENAKYEQSKMNAIQIDDMVGNVMYTAQIRLHNGDTQLHACMDRGNRMIDFTSAIKNK